MKVLIIGFTKVKYMPYMKFYMNQLIKSGAEVSLVYWDRDLSSDEPLPTEIAAYCFQDEMTDSESIIRKIPHFINFRKHASQIIKKNSYDLVIVLHTIPGVLLLDKLVRPYGGKYILDYRDYTYENHIVFRLVVKSLFKHSKMTFISSEGYLNSLPQIKKYILSHNLSADHIEDRSFLKNKYNTSKVRIRYWGMIRHENINREIISKLGNDSRFELHYHGREQDTADKLIHMVKEKNYENVFFHGEYSPQERYDFARESDLLLNIYENDIKTKSAMGNKYYDGLIFYLPQLCNKDSFMGLKAEKAEVGIMVSPFDERFADEIFDYYINLDKNDFFEKCDLEYDLINKEYINGINCIDSILKSIKASPN